MKRFFIASALLFCSHGFAQLSEIIKKINPPPNKSFTAAQVTAEDFGIKYFDKYCSLFQGDSVRYDAMGMVYTGWVEDTYKSGQLLHKGYYNQGKLTQYTNYFENGKVERELKPINVFKTTLNIYYNTGVIHSEIIYHKRDVISWKDYYPNGKLEYLEEYEKNGEKLIRMNSYNADGTLQSMFEVKDERKGIYLKKEYYDSGKLREEGDLHRNEEFAEYKKVGKWLVYDESGKLIFEEYYNEGELRTRLNK